MASDAEVICGFMEPDRVEGAWWAFAKKSTTHGDPVYMTNHSVPQFVTTVEDSTVPVNLGLDALRLVEARLTDEQWEWYMDAMFPAWLGNPRVKTIRQALHASAEDKVKALASVLRGGS